jgi:hypothetical protein
VNYSAPRDVRLRPDPSIAREAILTSLVRAVIATGLVKFDRTFTPADIARRTWNDRSVDLVLRAAVSPASLSNTPVLATVAVAYLESLVPQSAGADLLGRCIGLNFAGAAQINVPAIATPTADFVGEGQPIPVTTAPTSAGPTLLPYKLAVITTLTHEMMTNTNAERLIRQALLESAGPALDKQLFGTTAAVANERPAGLLNGISALTASSGTDKAQALVDDLQTLATAVAPVAGNSPIVLVAAPAQAVALRLRLPQPVDWPVLTSTALAAKTVIAIATNAVVSAVEGSPMIDASGAVELVRDTAPTSIDDAETAPMQYVGSLYQTDQVALRLRWPIGWALRTSSGLAYMTNVAW